MVCSNVLCSVLRRREQVELEEKFVFNSEEHILRLGKLMMGQCWNSRVVNKEKMKNHISPVRQADILCDHEHN